MYIHTHLVLGDIGGTSCSNVRGKLQDSLLCAGENKAPGGPEATSFCTTKGQPSVSRFPSQMPLGNCSTCAGTLGFCFELVNQRKCLFYPFLTSDVKMRSSAHPPESFGILPGAESGASEPRDRDMAGEKRHGSCTAHVPR